MQNTYIINKISSYKGIFMTTGLKKILKDMQKGMDPNGILGAFQKRRRQTRVPAIDETLSSIGEQLMLMGVFNPVEAYVGSSPKAVEEAIGDYDHIVEDLNLVGKLLSTFSSASRFFKTSAKLSGKDSNQNWRNIKIQKAMAKRKETHTTQRKIPKTEAIGVGRTCSCEKLSEKL